MNARMVDHGNRRLFRSWWYLSAVLVATGPISALALLLGLVGSLQQSSLWSLGLVGVALVGASVCLRSFTRLQLVERDGDLVWLRFLGVYRIPVSGIVDCRVQRTVLGLLPAVTVNFVLLDAAGPVTLRDAGLASLPTRRGRERMAQLALEVQRMSASARTNMTHPPDSGEPPVSAASSLEVGRFRAWWAFIGISAALLLAQGITEIGAGRGQEGVVASVFGALLALSALMVRKALRR